VHKPNWAWALAVPVAGKDPPAGVEDADLAMVLVDVETVVEVLELVELVDVVEFVGWWAAEAVRPDEWWLLAGDDWPGREPVAAAAAAPIPKAAIVAAAATLAERALVNRLFLPSGSAAGIVDATIADPLATTDASRASSLAVAGPVEARISAASPLKPGGASSGEIAPDSRRSAVASSMGNRCISVR
jgi:hypothetical protein